MCRHFRLTEDQILKATIATTVSAFNFRHRNKLTFVEAPGQVNLSLDFDGPWLTLIIPDLQPSLLAIERKPVPLKRHERIQRVVHVRSIWILHNCRHSVVDINILTKDAPISMVSISIFGPDIEFHARGALRNVIEEFALRFVRTWPAVRMTKRPFLSVHFETALCRNLDGICVEPRIDQIEVMRGLVYPQTSTLRFQSMPASKIISAVIHIEIPAEIDGNDAANLAWH